MPSLLMLLDTLLLAIGVFGLYTFLERRARSLGLSATQVRLLLSVTYAVGMVGAVAAGSLPSGAALSPSADAALLYAVILIAVFTSIEAGTASSSPSHRKSKTVLNHA